MTNLTSETTPCNIVPHTKDSKWDIIGINDNPFFPGEGLLYVIRNDMDNPYYMKLANVIDSKPEVSNLTPGLRGGLHWAGYYYNGGSYYKYAIDETQYWRVVSIENGEKDPKKNLATDFKNKDHYFCRSKYFYAVDLNKGLYYHAKSLAETPTKVTLRSDLGTGADQINPIAMWAGTNNYYILTMDKNNIPVVRYTSDPLDKLGTWIELDISNAMRSFLPGGSSNLHGGAAAKWVVIPGAGYVNNSDTEYSYKVTQTIKTGYSNTATNTLEQNWKISETISSEESAGVGADTLKMQMSLTAEFGGSEIQTSSSTWEASVENETELPMTAPPNGMVELYQVRVDGGNLSAILYGPFESTITGEPPTEDPGTYFVS
jgi:hypothetical protein